MVPDAQVSTQNLVITYRNDLGALRAAVDRLGGAIISTDDRIHVSIARFPTSSVEDLVRIRDALRAEGFDAAVTPTLPATITG